MDKLIEFLDSVLGGTFKSPYFSIKPGPFTFAFSKKGNMLEINFTDEIELSLHYLGYLIVKLMKISIDDEFIYIKTNYLTIPVSRKDLEKHMNQKA